MSTARSLKSQAPVKARSQYLFSVDDYHQLLKAGILEPTDRIELIHGELTMMPPIGPEHSANTSNLVYCIAKRLSDKVRLRVSEPISIREHSEPQPDLAVVKAKADHYKSAHPAPKDVLLVIEVADSSADFDNTVKAKLYGKAGIPEYWIVETAEACVRVFTEPSKQGYRTIKEYHRGDKVKCGTVPELHLAVTELLV